MKLSKNDIKFKGTFKNLKNLGFEFMKLYARNYKVYNKDLKGSHKLWLWVAQGGYLEIDDLYNCSKMYLEAIKSINWDEVDANVMSGTKYVNMYYNHCEPDKGFEIRRYGFDFYSSQLFNDKLYELTDSFSPNNLTEDEKSKLYEECYNKVREKYRDSKYIGEEPAKQLLKEIEKLQNS